MGTARRHCGFASASFTFFLFCVSFFPLVMTVLLWWTMGFDVGVSLRLGIYRLGGRRVWRLRVGWFLHLLTSDFPSYAVNLQLICDRSPYPSYMLPDRAPWIHSGQDGKRQTVLGGFVVV
jgi:hypothetical protein